MPGSFDQRSAGRLPPSCWCLVVVLRWTGQRLSTAVPRCPTVFLPGREWLSQLGSTLWPWTRQCIVRLLALLALCPSSLCVALRGTSVAMRQLPWRVSWWSAAGRLVWSSAALVHSLNTRWPLQRGPTWFCHVLLLHSRAAWAPPWPISPRTRYGVVHYFRSVAFLA